MRPTRQRRADVEADAVGAAGAIVEGDPKEIKQQRDVWTFTRAMTSDNPNWLLTGSSPSRKWSSSAFSRAAFSREVSV